MRRLTVIVMAVSAVLVIITGVAEASATHPGLATHHIAASSLFLLSACAHGWYNRKPVLKYFSGLGWRWALVACGFGAVLGIGALIA